MAHKNQVSLAKSQSAPLENAYSSGKVVVPGSFCCKLLDALPSRIRCFCKRTQNIIKILMTRIVIIFRFSFAWIIAVLSLLSSFFFLPRISVDIPAPYDPDHPTPISFVIANTNIIPLHYVRPGVGVGFLRYGPSRDVDPNFNGPAGSRFLFMQWQAEWLHPDEKYQIFLDELFHDMRDPPVRAELHANITIFVVFKPWYFPFDLTKEFRFVTKKLRDGKIYWVPTPLYR